MVDLRAGRTARHNHCLADGELPGRQGCTDEPREKFANGVNTDAGIENRKNRIFMLGHFFKTAWRNLHRYRLYALINILGIALGLAAFWLVALYVGDELSYD